MESTHLKKGSISSSFLKATAGIFNSAVDGYFTEAMPVSYSTIKEAKHTIGEVQSAFKNTAQSVFPTIKQLKSQGGFKSIMRWYTQQADEYDGYESGPSNFDDPELNGESSASEISESAQNANQISKAVVESSGRLAETQIESTANIITTIDAQTAAITSGFDRTNGTLDKMLEVMTKNTSTMIETMTAGFSAISSERSANDSMLAKGKFSLSEYKKILKKNWDQSDLGAGVSMIQMMFGMLQDPETAIGGLIGMGIDKIAPKLKGNINALDEAVNRTIMDSLIRLGENKNSDGFRGIFGQLLGVDATRKNADTARSELEVKSVPFDSITREAITNAIPGYLRKILVALGGKDEVYDYRSRSFRSSSDIKKDFRETAASSGTLRQASTKVRSAIGHDDFSSMLYDMLITDLGSKRANGESRRIIDQLQDKRFARQYMRELMKGYDLNGEQLRGLNTFARNLSNASSGTGAIDISNQAARTNLSRHARISSYIDNANMYEVDLSDLDDSVENDLDTIAASIGLRRKKKKKSSRASSVEAAKAKFSNLQGINYTNMALYEIYRRLNEGINVFQVGSSKKQHSRFKKLGDDYLARPSDYRPRSIGSQDVGGGESLSEISMPTLNDEPNELLNQELEDGTTENLSRGERFARWGKKKGGALARAMFSGSPAQVKAAFDSMMIDVAGVASDSAKKGISQINSSFGNISGYLKHKIFGHEYSYQTGIDNEGNPIFKHIAKNEKGGVFGFISDSVKDMFSEKKEGVKEWFKDVAGFFDYSGNDPEEKQIEGKRKKILAASVGAFAGLGILGGPMGLLVGALAGNALSGTGIGKKLKEKLFGRDDESGKAKGIITKAVDGIVDPIHYQISKTMKTAASSLKNNILAPLGDIGRAIRDRAVYGAKHYFSKFFKKILDNKLVKTVTGFIKKPFEWMGKGMGWLGGKIGGGLLALPGVLTRGAIRGGSRVIGGGLSGIAQHIAAGTNYGNSLTDEEGNVISGREFFRNRRQEQISRGKHERDMDNYKTWKAAKHNKRAAMRRKFKDYTTEDVSIATAESTEQMARTTEEISRGVDQITGEIIPGSSFKTHDQGLHERLDKLLTQMGRGATDSIVSGAIGLVGTNDDVSSDEEKALTSMVEESTKEKGNKSTIVSKFKNLLSINRKKTEIEMEKKSSLWETIKGFAGGLLSGVGGILGNIANIAKVAAAGYLIFKDWNSENSFIKRAFSSLGRFLEKFNSDDRDGANDGANLVTESKADVNADSVLSYANPLSSLYHADVDGAGNRIKNYQATKVKDQMLYRANVTASIRNDPTYTQASSGALAKGFRRQESFYQSAAEKIDNSWFGNTKFGKRVSEKLQSSASNKAKAAEYQENISANRSSVGGHVMDMLGDMGVIWGGSKIIGGATKLGLRALGKGEESADNWGYIAESGTSALLTSNYLQSSLTGQKSIAAKIKDFVKDALKWIAKKIGKEQQFSQFTSKITSFTDEIYEKTVGKFTKEIIEKISAKILAVTGKDIASALTLGIPIAIGAVNGLINGATGAAYMFRVLPEDTDVIMNTISTLLKGVLGALEFVPVAGYFVAILDIIDMILISIPGLGKGFTQLLAELLYNCIDSLSGNKWGETLASKQGGFSDEVARYNEKYGTNLSLSAANDLINNTGWIDRMWRGKKTIGEDGTYDHNFNEAGGELYGGIKGALVTTGDISYVKDGNGNVLRINGEAIERKDSFGNTKMNSRNFGDYASAGLSTLKKLLGGTTIYKTDENGDAIVDENGNYVVDHEESGILSWINPFNKDRKKNMEEDTEIRKLLEDTKSEIRDMAMDGLSTVGNFFMSPFKKIKKAFEKLTGIELVDDDGVTIKDKKGNAVKMDDIGSYFKDNMMELGSMIIGPIKSATDGIKKGAKDLKDNVVEKAGSFWEMIKDSISGMDSWSNGVGGPMDILSNDGGSSNSSTSARSSVEGGNPINEPFSITSPFGHRSDPYPGEHKGVDIVPASTNRDNVEVGSRYSGTVVQVKSNVSDDDHAFVGEDGKFDYTGDNETGNMVTIKADNGLVIKNMHLKAGSIPKNIHEGVRINAGDKIGIMGNTGWSTGPHLHYQIEKNGEPIDPESTLSGGSSISSFNSNGSATYPAAESPYQSDDLSTYDYSAPSVTGDDSSTSATGPLGEFISRLRSIGNDFLSEITGGLIGSSSSDENGSYGSYDSSFSSYDSTGSSFGSYGLSSSSNSEWVNCVRTVKEAVAAQHPVYNQSGYITINVGGKSIRTRTDCTGIICAMLKLYGVVNDNYSNNSDGFLRDGAIPNGFDKAPWPGWDNLVEGDIIVRSGHAEVFARNEGSSHLVYNGGSTKSLGSPGATHTSHKDGYSVIWRCREQASEEDPFTSSVTDIAKIGLNAFSLNRLSSDASAQDIWNYLKRQGYSDVAIAGIMGCWHAETGNDPKKIEGYYLKRFPGYDKVMQNSQTLDEYTGNVLFPAYKKITINRSAYMGDDGHYYPGFGLAQWTGPRGYNLLQYTKSRGLDWRDASGQLEFFNQEMDNRGLKPQMNQQTSIDEATNIFGRKYEGVKRNDWMAQRRDYAKAIYNQFHNTNADSSAIATDGMGGPEIDDGRTSSIASMKVIPNTRSNMKNGTTSLNYIRSAINGGGSVSYKPAKSSGYTGPDTSDAAVPEEVLKAIYLVLDELRNITGNTGSANSLLESLNEKDFVDQGLRDSLTTMGNSRRIKANQLYRPTNSSIRTISSMARP